MPTPSKTPPGRAKKSLPSLTSRPATHVAPKKPLAKPMGTRLPIYTAKPAPDSRDTSWGEVASWYDRLLGGESGTFQKEVILPNLLRLMAVKPEEHVVDVACGQGFFAGALVQAGATVAGVDISKELIEKAKVNAPGATFHISPATSMPQIPDGWASQAVIVLAIQNIEDARGVFAECSRMLSSGGRLHVIMNHPAFRIPKRTAWGWDKENRQYRRIDGYLTESKIDIDMHPGSDPGSRTVSFHRPLQYYVKALARNGFNLANLEEWISHKVSDSGPRAPEENRARREFPLFLYLEAIKQ